MEGGRPAGYLQVSSIGQNRSGTNSPRLTKILKLIGEVNSSHCLVNTSIPVYSDMAKSSYWKAVIREMQIY